MYILIAAWPKEEVTLKSPICCNLLAKSSLVGGSALVVYLGFQHT